MLYTNILFLFEKNEWKFIIKTTARIINQVYINHITLMGIKISTCSSYCMKCYVAHIIN